MEEKLTIPLTYCPSYESRRRAPLIEHFIPVMLAKPHESLPSFGPLYDDWNAIEIEEARPNVSGIVINSKNLTDAKNRSTAYITANNSNVTGWESPPGVANNKLWLTILQEFGPRQI